LLLARAPETIIVIGTEGRLLLDATFGSLVAAWPSASAGVATATLATTQQSHDRRRLMPWAD
jgi:hypothetical protein